MPHPNAPPGSPNIKDHRHRQGGHAAWKYWHWMEFRWGDLFWFRIATLAYAPLAGKSCIIEQNGHERRISTEQMTPDVGTFRVTGTTHGLWLGYRRTRHGPSAGHRSSSLGSFQVGIGLVETHRFRCL